MAPTHLAELQHAAAIWMAVARASAGARSDANERSVRSLPGSSSCSSRLKLWHEVSSVCMAVSASWVKAGVMAGADEAGDAAASDGGGCCSASSSSSSSSSSWIGTFSSVVVCTCGCCCCRRRRCCPFGDGAALGEARVEVIEQRVTKLRRVVQRVGRMLRVHAHVDRSHLELGAQPAVGQGIGLVKGRRCGDTVRALEARRDKLEHLGAQPAIPDEVGCLRGRVEQHEELGRVLLLVLAVEKLGEVLSEHAPRTPADGGVGVGVPAER